EAQLFEEIQRLVQASRDEEVPPRGKIAEKQFKDGRLGLPMIQIGLDHVELIQVSQEGARCGVYHLPRRSPFKPVPPCQIVRSERRAIRHLYADIGLPLRRQGNIAFDPDDRWSAASRRIGPAPRITDDDGGNRRMTFRY